MCDEQLQTFCYGMFWSSGLEAGLRINRALLRLRGHNAVDNVPTSTGQWKQVHFSVHGTADIIQHRASLWQNVVAASCVL